MEPSGLKDSRINPEGADEIVHVDRTIEVIPPLVRISIGVGLPSDELWFWVEFMCWGQSCGTVFFTIEEALRWCVSCYSKNIMRPVSLKDKEGMVLYDEGRLVRHCQERF